MFSLLKQWFGIGAIDCTDPIDQQLYCPSDMLINNMFSSGGSSEPIGGCSLDLNGNGICDFIDPTSPLSGMGGSMFDD